MKMHLLQIERLLGLSITLSASCVFAQTPSIPSTLIRPSDAPKFIKLDMILANGRPFIDIRVGSDPQPFSVMADTGAPATWVASKQNPADPGFNPPTVVSGEEFPTHQYDRSSGGFTYLKRGRRKRPVIYAYGIDVYVEGFLVDTTLKIGSLAGMKAMIGFAETQTHLEESGFHDEEGRFGLGMEMAAMHPVVFDVMVAMHTTTQVQFSLDYIEADSSLTLGEDPDSLPITNTIPLNDLRKSFEGWWKTSIKAVAFSADTRLEPEGMIMVFMTSNQFITMSPRVVTRYYTRLAQGAARLTTNQYNYPIWLVKCGAALPDLIFKLPGRGKQIKISGRRLYLRLSNSGEWCAGALQPDPDDKTSQVDPTTKLGYLKFGYPFFKTYFTTWNYGVERDRETGKPEAIQPTIGYAFYPDPDTDDEEEELAWGVKENEVLQASGEGSSSLGAASGSAALVGSRGLSLL